MPERKPPNNKAGLWEYFHNWVLRAWYGNEEKTVKYKIEGKTMNATNTSLNTIGLAVGWSGESSQLQTF